MNDKLTMSEPMYLTVEELCWFKASGLPGGGEAFFANMRAMPHKSLWRIHGKQNWQRFKEHCHEPKTVLHFANGTEIVVDLSEYSPTLSDMKASSHNPQVNAAIRGWC
jgi:hypothetical protein